VGGFFIGGLDVGFFSGGGVGGGLGGFVVGGVFLSWGVRRGALGGGFLGVGVCDEIEMMKFFQSFFLSHVDVQSTFSEDNLSFFPLIFLRPNGVYW